MIKYRNMKKWIYQKHIWLFVKSIITVILYIIKAQ